MTASKNGSGGTPAILSLASALAVAGVAGLLRIAGLTAFPAPLHLSLLIMILLFTGAELAQIHIEFGRHTFSFSLTEMPLVLGLFFCEPTTLVIARLAGGVAALFLRRRAAPVKLAFNGALFFLEPVLAVILLRSLLSHHSPSSHVAWLATYAASAAVTLYGTASVLAAISFTSARPTLARVTNVVGGGCLTGLFTTSLGLLMVAVLRSDVEAWMLLVPLSAVLALAYSGYSSLQRRHTALGLVNRFTRAVTGIEDGRALVDQLLAEVRDVLSAESAEITLLPDGDAEPRRVSAGPDGRRTVFGAVDWLRARTVTTGQPLVLSRGTREPAMRRWLQEQGLRDAVIVPLPGEGGPAGLLLVGNRVGNTATFGPHDLTVLETLAAHTAIALANGRLVDQLRHDALHDALTGLANRALLGSRLEQQLESDRERADGRRSAVALLDLDRFKEVNDTLGHHSGDTLLREAARRLTSATVDWPCVARLGGDEFAVVLPPVRSGEEALRVLAPVLSVFETPFQLEGMEVEVGASAGVSLPDASTGGDAVLLMRRADLAMYACKKAGESARVFDDALDSGSPEKLSLVAELRRALDAGALEVYYQPKVLLGSGRVCGVEALARWQHPQRGMIPPDVFIPLAEHTGMVGTLTQQVLAASVGQCAAWHAMGLELGVAVNVSVRALLDPELPANVARVLRTANLAPHWLTLEITESSVMSEPGRTMPVLHQLAGLGVRLSVDDFGTGYSSLSYLQRLPVNEVKVDKSFVQEMGDGGPGAAIVRAVVDLGHSLTLAVVAEGVEDESTRKLLAAMGCDILQGYLLCRPLPAADVTGWLCAREGAVGRPPLRLVPTGT